MSDISEWSTVEAENTHIDELTLSGESGQYINKIMCAVKAKTDEQDSQLAEAAETIGAVQETLGEMSGALSFKGTVATAEDLPADASAGDTYAVEGEGGVLFAWNGEEWVSLGVADSGLVHTTGDETVQGTKTFTNNIKCKRSGSGAYAFSAYTAKPYVGTAFDSKQHNFAALTLYDVNEKQFLNVSSLTTATHNTETGLKYYSVFDNATPYAGRLLFREAASGEGSDVSLCVLPDLVPDVSETYSLGRASKMWSEVFSQTAAINTSDERKKTSIAAIPDDVLDAWGDVDFRQYQLTASVAEKGESARLHAGCIAQQIASVFASRGLDASRYGLFCHDEWQALPEVADEDGTVLHEAVPAGDMYSLRYEEALCVEAAYQRRRADRLEARIAALEARLNGND